MLFKKFLVALGLHCCRISVVVKSGSYSHCVAWALYCPAFSCCWGCALGVQTQKLWCTGLVALRHVESSRTRDQTRVPCPGRWTLIHCTTREICHTSSKRLSYLRNHRTVSTSCEHPILGKSLLPWNTPHQIIYPKPKSYKFFLTPLMERPQSSPRGELSITRMSH